MVDKLKLTNGRVFYSNGKSTVTAGKISSDISSGEIQVDSVSMVPVLSKTGFF